MISATQISFFFSLKTKTRSVFIIC